MHLRMLVSACSIALALSVTGANATCNSSRDLCAAKPLLDAKAAAKKPTVKTSAVKLIELEKAPPDGPRAPVKQANVWAPIDVPSQAVQLETVDARSTNGLSGNVRVVSADEVNEIDLAVPAVLDSIAIKVVPIRVATDNGEGVTNATASQNQPPADTSLIERVFVTFGGAFGAASAFRVFFG